MFSSAASEKASSFRGDRTNLLPGQELKRAQAHEACYVYANTGKTRCNCCVRRYGPVFKNEAFRNLGAIKKEEECKKLLEVKQ